MPGLTERMLLAEAEALRDKAFQRYNARPFPKLDKATWFYKNCQRQRKRGAKICQTCPFREGIEEQEACR